MAYDAWFDREENKSLIAICARSMIKGIGIGALIWGIINIALGIYYTTNAGINIILVFIAILMAGAGILTLLKPGRNMILLDVIMSLMLFGWNLFVAILNNRAGAPFEPRGLIFPVIIAISFTMQYIKLGAYSELIRGVEPEDVKQAEKMCKQLFKEKIKENDSVAVASSGESPCRVQNLGQSMFVALQSMAKAFVLTRDEFVSTLADSQAVKIKMTVNHPLGKLNCTFNKDNSEKIRGWLETQPEDAGETNPRPADF